MTTSLAKSSWSSVASYLQEGNDTILLPIGSSEQHGPGPLGTDTIIACRIAEEAAKRKKVLVAPPIYYGYSFIHTSFPGTVNVSAETLEQLGFEILADFFRQGFRRVVIVNGHGSNRAWLDPLQKKLEKTLPDLRLLIFEWWKAPEVQELERKLFNGEHGAHAGSGEMSIISHILSESNSKVPPIREARGWTGNEKLTPQKFRELFPHGVVGPTDLRLTGKRSGHKILIRAVEAVARLIAEHEEK